MTEVEEVSLRPLSLRPGGGGFSAFSKGAGLGLRATAKPVSAAGRNALSLFR
jgi:hypothetical protein